MKSSTKAIIVYFLFTILGIGICGCTTSAKNEFLGNWIRLNPKMRTLGDKIINEYLTISENGKNLSLSKTDDYSIKEKNPPRLYTSVFDPETNTLILSEGLMSVRFSIMKETGILNAGFLGQYKRRE